MKKVILFLAILCSLLQAQEVKKGTDDTQYKSLLLERSTGASAEALGRMSFNFEPNAFSVKTNPAAVTEGWSAAAGYSYSSPYADPEYFKGSYYDYEGMRVSLGNIGSFGFSRYYVKEFEEPVMTIDHPEGTGETIVFDSYMHSFSYSREVINGLYIGMLANYFCESFSKISYENASLGFGAVKIFELPSFGGFSNIIGVGATLENIIKVYEKHNVPSNGVYVDLDPRFENNNTSVLDQLRDFDIVIPQRMDLSLSYKGKFPLISAKAQFEYRKVLNSEYYTEIAEAFEAGVYNSLFLRIGNYSHTDFSDEFENTLTYGAGVKISGALLGVKFPFAVTFDYADLPLKKYFENDEEKRYSIYSIGLSYDFN